MMIVALGSFNSIQHWGQEVGLRAAAGEEGSVASHEVKGDALEQLTDCFMLVRSIVPGKGGPKAFELGHCNLVHTTESFQGDWQENKALLPAGARDAFEATSNMRSRRRSCLAILSPLFEQERAWSPHLSLGRPQAGQGPSVE